MHPRHCSRDMPWHVAKSVTTESVALADMPWHVPTKQMSIRLIITTDISDENTQDIPYEHQPAVH